MKLKIAMPINVYNLLNIFGTLVISRVPSFLSCKNFDIPPLHGILKIKKYTASRLHLMFRDELASH